MDLTWNTNINKRSSRRTPNQAISSFASEKFTTIPNCRGALNDWVTCAFSPNSDTLLYLGGNEGDLALFDVRHASGDPDYEEGGILSNFTAHNGVIMDIKGVPNMPNQVLTVAGDTYLRLWDVGYRHPRSTLFAGHEGTVRAACFAPEDSNVFVTAGRDGQIRLWDNRMNHKKTRKTNLEFTPSTNVYTYTHSIKDLKKPGAKRTPGKKRDPPPKVVSVLYLNDYAVASASESAASGVRVWDTRKMPVNAEGHMIACLDVPLSVDKKRSVGIASLALDRHRSSLFVAVTDSSVHEYDILTTETTPVRSLSGAQIKSFDIVLCSSPVSDHLLCGSVDNKAVLWDLQNSHRYLDDTPHVETRRFTPELRPSHTFEGHDSAVSSVAWSCGGNYIVSLDDTRCRVWSRNFAVDSEENLVEKDPDLPSFERVHTRVQLRPTWAEDVTERVATVSTVPVTTRPQTRAFLSPKKSPCKHHHTPLSSPLKTPRARTPSKKTPTKSPGAKVMKLTSPVLPLTETTNTAAPTPRSARKRKSRRRVRNAFHALYPTDDLPNSVYDRFLRDLHPSIEATGSTVNSPSMSGCKKLEDWWQRMGEMSGKRDRLNRVRLPSVTEFGESICSKMVTEDERVMTNSPRKLVLKQSPVKKMLPAVEKVVAASTQPKRRSNRNLLDYFTKK